MEIFDGIINYSLFFIVLLIFFNGYRAFKKSQKALLLRTVISLISLVVCVYYILNIENVFRLQDVLKLYNLPFPKGVSIVAFIVCYVLVYVFVGRVIKFTLKLTNGLNFFKDRSPIQQKLNLILIIVRKTILITFMITFLSVMVQPLYTSGITKPIVDLKVASGTQTDLMHDLDYMTDKREEIDTFLTLFSSEELKKDFQSTGEIRDEISLYEALFMRDVFPRLTKQQKSIIDDSFYEVHDRHRKDDYTGILVVISDPDIYKLVFENSDMDISGAKQYVTFLSRVKVINQLLFEEEQLAFIECKSYIEKNKALIKWMNEERDVIDLYNKVDNDLDERELVELLVNSLSENESKLKEIKDKQNRERIDDMINAIDHYYFMENWAMNTLESEQSIDFTKESNAAIIDDAIYDQLNDPKALDVLIENYAADYKGGYFKNLSKKHELKTAYQFSNDYLNHYQTYSTSLDLKLAPATRLEASVLHEDLEIESYLHDQIGLEWLLTYLIDEKSCDVVQVEYKKFRTSICKQESVYKKMDAFMWGYLITHDAGTYLVDNEKLSKLFESISGMSQDKRVSIEMKLKTLNDQLLFANAEQSSDSYIEMYYGRSIIGYDVMKLLYKNEAYTSSIFNEKIEDVIK